jgi:hypothetical protein
MPPIKKTGASSLRGMIITRKSFKEGHITAIFQLESNKEKLRFNGFNIDII